MAGVQVLDADDDKVEVVPLGSGQEVGRSCVLVKFKGRQIMFDCGIHPAMTGVDSLPFFDRIDAEEIDLVLVTHFHLDHCGAVPYFLEETRFCGKVVMTHPTKKIFRMVMQDFIRVTQGATDVCTEHWLEASLQKIETLDYHQEGSHNGIKFHSYNAGHVLGAGMWMAEIAGVRVLYTGDYSRAPDRHLMGAETPMVSPDVLVVESTYGIQVHEKREERERKFTGWVHNIVARGGRCLLPVFALGRAQELLLILDEYWSQHKELQSIPIYYASTLAKRCNGVFESYISHMNDRVRRQYDVIKHKRNPFSFKYITLLKDLRTFDDNGPCVVLASPGMLQSGVSRELFEKWCPDEKNGVVIAGYCVAGTLARQIQARPAEIQREDGRVLPLRMQVETVSFSAHSDYSQTKEFVETLGVKHVILVHGDPMNMARLRERITQELPALDVHMPRNTATVAIPFRPQRVCKVIGAAADAVPIPGTRIRGVMVVGKDFQHSLVDPGDLTSYTELPVTKLQHAVDIPLPHYYSVTDVLAHLGKHFEGVTLVDQPPVIREDEESSTLRIGRDPDTSEVSVRVEQTSTAGREATTLTVQWSVSRYADVLADCVSIALLQLHLGTQQQMPQEMADELFRLRCMHRMLTQHFAGVRFSVGPGTFSFQYQGTPVQILPPFTVQCDSALLREKVESVVHRIYLAIWPLPDDMGWCGCGDEACAWQGRKRPRGRHQTKRDEIDQFTL
eukprot:TRINITY_DN4428_c3_g1_i1.p1 TRINITY_DN4428_c3_g1~~TRINITY_DN4428_c3_g1_i1.p1  ORF type:complete len:759 (+),score=236.96 TRINITY_DN4428_c3_g1_i1:82-2277(+)